MPKKAGVIFVITGAVLILSALLLLLYNRQEEYRAGKEAELLLADIQSLIAKQEGETVSGFDGALQNGEVGRTDAADKEDTGNGTAAENRTDAEDETDAENLSEAEGTEAGKSLQETTLPAELPVVTIKGYGYIGYLSIPDLKLDLPIMAEWDYKRLKVAPCRHYGSSRTDDLVIAAHNYKSHFGSLSGLEIGAEICFTDMDGIENHYTLQKLETLAPDAVDIVLNSEYDLVLYTCTPGGKTRVVAFCSRTS